MAGILNRDMVFYLIIIDVHPRKLTWLAGKSPCSIGNTSSNGGFFIAMLVFGGGAGGSNCNSSFFAWVQTSCRLTGLFLYTFTETVDFFSMRWSRKRVVLDNSLLSPSAFKGSCSGGKLSKFHGKMSNFGQYNWNPQESRSSFRSVWMMVIFPGFWTIVPYYQQSQSKLVRKFW